MLITPKGERVGGSFGFCWRPVRINHATDFLNDSLKKGHRVQKMQASHAVGGLKFSPYTSHFLEAKNSLQTL